MRIWCVSIVLMLTFNSLANSETLRSLPIKEKISNSRLLRLLISELREFLLPSSRLRPAELFHMRYSFLRKSSAYRFC